MENNLKFSKTNSEGVYNSQLNVTRSGAGRFMAGIHGRNGRFIAGSRQAPERDLTSSREL